ncbi:hypothetical protein GP486_005150, partial [Trichoglossum hirsutum]
MHALHLLPPLLLLLSPLAHAACKTVVTYDGGADPSALGSPELEGQNLHDKIGGNTASAYIKAGADTKGVAALMFHRDAHVRRAEVRAKGNYAAENKYHI